MKINSPKIAAPKAKPTSKNWNSSSPAGIEKKLGSSKDQVGMSPPKTKALSKTPESRPDPAELEAALARAAELTSTPNRAKPSDKNFSLGSEGPDRFTVSREGLEAKAPDKKPSFIQLFEEQNKF